ncbi:MAG: hypothetical protein KJO23_01065 [Bacteroidia bacterium]|nr:hypothetical protein [Bacteroidia bacterium]
MKRLIVTAHASPIFGNFLMLVSVSTEDEGKPVTKLTKSSFEIHRLASLNHASAHKRVIDKVKEGPAGCYIVTLKPWEYQPDLPPGHYTFSVGVKKSIPVIGQVGQRPKPAKYHMGQTIAWGELPKYGNW